MGTRQEPKLASFRGLSAASQTGEVLSPPKRGGRCCLITFTIASISFACVWMLWAVG